MKTLGLSTGGDCGAAVVEDGRVAAAVNEERLSRVKLVKGFPRASVRRVLELASTEAGELDAVLVGATNGFWVDGLQSQEEWLNWDRSGGIGARVKRMAGTFSRLRDRLPVLERVYYGLMEPSYRKRRRRIRETLREEFGVTAPVVFVDHHLCHAASAYFTSGLSDALVVTLDGGGDGNSGLVAAVRDGRFEVLHRVPAFHSLGNWYAYVTHLCGFQAHRHEGKITGLAAHGEPRHLDVLREFIAQEGEGFVNRGGLVFRQAMDALEERLPDGWRREDLAASVQVLFEEAVRRFVGHWARRTGLRDVAVAGGVFANVRVNQEVHELEEVDRVFVHPGMTDGGLGLGAALSACLPEVLEGVAERPMAWPRAGLEHVYLGPAISPEEADRALGERGISPEPLDGPLEERVADLLAAGHVVAVAQGPMEYGPRALGNRSILYRPTDPSAMDWLNERLDRTEFMPFAPAVLEEEKERCFLGLEGAEHAAEFMTITFDCTPWMRREMTGVVHVDGTARPQLVRREANPFFHGVLRAYERRTGLPVLLNTSFNRHGEPIVCGAEDALRSFEEGRLDYLVLGPRLVRAASVEDREEDLAARTADPTGGAGYGRGGAAGTADPGRRRRPEGARPL